MPFDAGAASAGPRENRVIPAFRIFSAPALLRPSRPSMSSYSIGWLSLSVCRPAAWTAVMWTKMSLPPSAGWMKPYPFSVLNHLTVPLAIPARPSV